MNRRTRAMFSAIAAIVAMISPATSSTSVAVGSSRARSRPRSFTLSVSASMASRPIDAARVLEVLRHPPRPSLARRPCLDSTMDLRIATDDDVRLVASVHLPEAAGPVACAVALHAAAAGTRDHPLYRHVAATLGELGVAVCVFDRRGEGGSSGQPGASLDRLAADGAAVARAVRELPEVDPDLVGVWGISQGGWLGPLVAVRDDAISFVIAVSASGVSPSTQMHFAMENILDERGFTSADIATAHRVRERIEAAYRDGEATAALAALRTVEQEPWFPYAYLPTAEDPRGSRRLRDRPRRARDLRAGKGADARDIRRVGSLGAGGREHRRLAGRLREPVATPHRGASRRRGTHDDHARRSPRPRGARPHLACVCRRDHLVDAACSHRPTGPLTRLRGLRAR